MKKISLIATILLPLIATGIFDKMGLVVYMAIPWLIISIPSLFLVLFLAKRCKIPTKGTYIALLALSIIYSMYLSVHYYRRFTPEGQFRTYFRTQLPPSVQNLKVDGVVYATGGQVEIVFDVSPDDCDKLIHSIGLASVSEEDLANKAEFRAIQKEDYENTFPRQVIYIDSEYEGMSYRMLIVNEAKTKVHFKRYRI